MKDIQKVCRGQVWWVDENRTVVDGRIGLKQDNVQAKSRPWLVVSCEENNYHAPTVNCVPISTLDKDHYPMHVFFTYNDKPQNILCEQIKTINICELRTYMYTLTKGIMDRVNTAVANQLGLTMSSPTYDELVALIDRIAKQKAEELKDKFSVVSDDAVIDIASRIESCFDIVNKGKQASDSEVQTDEPEFEIFEPEEPVVIRGIVSDTPKDIPVGEKQPKKRKPHGPHRRWTAEVMDEFLTDLKVLSPEAMMKKYDLPDKKSVFKKKYYFTSVRGTDNGTVNKGATQVSRG